MTTTTNYGYTVVVGSDTPVNIQNDIAPNFTAIDTDLKAVSDSAITDATHTYSAGLHSLVRTDADRNVFYFVATADMTLGDSFSVDGVPVTARLVNGEALGTGSFVINNNVLCILVGTVLNILAVNPVATPNASQVSYDNTTSGLTATNVQNAIDEIAPKGKVEVVADGVKTMSELLDQLHFLVDATKLNAKSVLYLNTGAIDAYAQITDNSTVNYTFKRMQISTTDLVCVEFIVKTSGSVYDTKTQATYVDGSATVITSGWKIGIIY